MMMLDCYDDGVVDERRSFSCAVAIRPYRVSSYQEEDADDNAFMFMFCALAREYMHREMMRDGGRVGRSSNVNGG